MTIIISLNNTTESNRYIIDDGYLTISLSDNIDNPYYNWEFSVGNAYDFRSFSSTYNNQPTLRLRGMDFLSDSDIGKPVYIRVNMGSCAGSNRTSNTIDFTSKKSSPRILGVTATDKICHGAANGKLKVQLDRPLLSGERLFVDYKNLTTQTIGNVPDPTIGSDNSFYLENLDAGNYEIQVSGFYNGNTTYSDGLDYKKTGKIESFLPLIYSTASKTDITCFGADNGSITVTSSGGDGSYKLHWRKQGGSYITTAFTSSTQTSLSNLQPGTYEYYVIDTHDCELRGQDGNIITRTETLVQPTKALVFAFLSSTEPSGYNRSDGSVTLEGDGGTPLTGNSYTATWK
ncbi:SprB repeat-containing protein [Dysgonomonas sp. GY617]|uniref:SprB repeat-containing protein n=1 Tax=Dysgonomonas sp. GY617 TaxID=2780420 RepID=UPI0018832A1C|nr:SprB repeat-containing protein [Dysgonomonas sp. GY617]MBF0578126.1 SprB repeat-containing protein [Dysgonomonas sp. GY617]